MTPSVPALLDSFRELTVLVLGDAMLDSYIQGPAPTLSREAPVPVVKVESRRDVPGGAANTAANVRHLGAAAILLSVVGDDGEGALLRSALEDCGVA
ncbi:MAG: D-glycero-beta-D-manno-heptose 1-phosphate adenylyltransferase, partial [Thermoleophilia bacterium]|nr:D-glycero-beta-D-manno-heptose 1-phosphate adenylyltransferase [Thermoleophilia bacterium]